MSQVTNNSKIIDLTETAVSSSATLKLTETDYVSYQVHYVDATPAAKTFVAANVKTNVQSPASSVTITAHGFTTGLKVALTGTNLPTGLSATTYWIIVNSVDSISFATSLALATAGTKVSITGAGTTADATITPALLVTTGFVVKLQQSNDGVTWFDVSGVTVTITATGDTLWLVNNPPCLYHRVVITPTTGALTIWVLPCVRNNTIFSPGI
jgi:hypothetical protein